MELRRNPYAKLTFKRDAWGELALLEAPVRDRFVTRTTVWKQKNAELYALLKKWSKRAPNKLKKSSCPGALAQAGYYLPKSKLPSAARLQACQRDTVRAIVRKRDVPPENHRAFGRQAFSHLPVFLARPELNALQTYYAEFLRQGFAGFDDGLVERRYFAHDDKLGRRLLQLFSPTVSAIVGKKVKPAYSYFISYVGGAKLAPHTDRPQCRYTLSLQIDARPARAPRTRQWALKLSDGTRTSTIRMSPGDALLFSGVELKHWRAPLKKGSTSTLIMLHYVDARFRGRRK